MKKRDSRTTTALSVFLVLPFQAAHAQESVNFIGEQANNSSVLAFDFGVPDTPATALLGLESSAITTSTSLKPFVIAVPSLLDGDDHSQALGLDISPAWILQGFGKAEPTNYADGTSYFQRLTHRTRLSVGLFRGTAGTPMESDESMNTDDTAMAGEQASRVSLGITLSLLDTSDPLTAGDGRWSDCLRTKYDEIKPLVTKKYFDEPGLLLGRLQLLEEKIPKTLRSIEDTSPETLAKLQNAAKQWRLEFSHPSITPTEGSEWTTVNEAENAIRQYTYAVESKKSEVEKIMESRFKKELNDLQFDGQDKLGFQAAIDSCTEEANELARNAADIDIGFAQVWSGEPGELNNFERPSSVFWGAVKIPLGSLVHKDMQSVKSGVQRWNIGGSVRFATNEMLSTEYPNNPLIEADTVNGWIGVERVSGSYRISGRYGWLDVSPSDPIGATLEKSGERFLINASYKVSGKDSGTWLDISYGSADGTIDALNDTQLRVSLLFGPTNNGGIF